ncbi:MAG TPA: hypothetical protein VMO47_06020 [Rhodothermales bacterium]|nr:hypothetical protein [Rhodothermales bacterium]
MKRVLAVVCCTAVIQLGCSDPISVQSPTESAAGDLAIEEFAAVLTKNGASGKVKAPAADLEVEILESNSDFINHIYLVSPGPDLFIGTDDDWGTVVALPSVRRNEELIFEIRVHDPSNVDTGVRWQTGPPSRNSDHQFHAQVEYQTDGSIKVSFEDVDASSWGVGDEPNYLDAIFVVRES